MEDKIKPNEPITIVINYQIQDKYEAEFRKTIADIIHACTNFSGFAGKQVLYTKMTGKTDYTVLVRWDTMEQWKKWEESPIRAELRDKINELNTLQDSTYHYLTGLESWFSLGTSQTIIPPPRYKIAILTWASVYFLLLVIFSVFGKYLEPLAMPVRVLIVSVTMVLLITYVIMPMLTKLFKRWLYPYLFKTAQSKKKKFN